MAVTQVVFIYSTVAPFSLCATVLTDDNDHPGVPVLQRPECSAVGYSANGVPCTSLVMPFQTYQNLTAPIERDTTLVTAIWAQAAPGQPVPPGLIGPPVVVTGPVGPPGPPGNPIGPTGPTGPSLGPTGAAI